MNLQQSLAPVGSCYIIETGYYPLASGVDLISHGQTIHPFLTFGPPPVQVSKRG